MPCIFAVSKKWIRKRVSQVEGSRGAEAREWKQTKVLDQKKEATHRGT
jgi:hypothetical protein